MEFKDYARAGQAYVFEVGPNEVFIYKDMLDLDEVVSRSSRSIGSGEAQMTVNALGIFIDQPSPELNPRGNIHAMAYRYIGRGANIKVSQDCGLRAPYCALTLHKNGESMEHETHTINTGHRSFVQHSGPNLILSHTKTEWLSIYSNTIHEYSSVGHEVEKGYTVVQELATVPNKTLELFADCALMSVMSTQTYLALPNSTEAGCQEALAYLDWLATGIPEDTGNPKLMHLLEVINTVRGSALLASRRNYVPFYAPRIYNESIKGMLDSLASIANEQRQDRRADDIKSHVTTSLAVLNENIIANSNNFQQYLSAVSKQAQSFEDHYNILTTVQIERTDSIRKQIEEVKGKAESFKNEYTAKLEAYQSALKLAASIETAKAVAGIVGGVLTALVTFGVGAGKAVEASEKVADAAEKAADVAKKVEEVGKTAATLEKLAKILDVISKLIDAGKTLCSKGPAMFKNVKVNAKGINDAALPSEAEWEQALNDFEACLPDPSMAGSERAALVASYRNFILWNKEAIRRMKELIDAEYQAAASARLSELNKSFYEQLGTIHVTAATLPTPAAQSAAQIGLVTTELSIQAKLAVMYCTLDRAQQYYLGMPPTDLKPSSINWQDMQALLSERRDQILAHQNKQLLLGHRFRRPNIAITFPGVRVEQILNGHFAELTIRPEDHAHKKFANLMDIRVQDVRIALSVKGGKLKVHTGEAETYILEWRVDGRSFFDVSGRNRYTEWSTAPMSGFVHRVAADNALASQPISGYQSNSLELTPFTTWRVGVRDGDEPISFTVEKSDQIPPSYEPVDTVDVTLEFDVYARTLS